MNNNDSYGLGIFRAIRSVFNVVTKSAGALERLAGAGDNAAHAVELHSEILMHKARLDTLNERAKVEQRAKELGFEL